MSVVVSRQHDSYERIKWTTPPNVACAVCGTRFFKSALRMKSKRHFCCKACHVAWRKPVDPVDIPESPSFRVPPPVVAAPMLGRPDNVELIPHTRASCGCSGSLCVPMGASDEVIEKRRLLADKRPCPACQRDAGPAHVTKYKRGMTMHQ